jgi:hypothetical protein
MTNEFAVSAALSRPDDTKRPANTLPSIKPTIVPSLINAIYKSGCIAFVCSITTDAAWLKPASATPTVTVADSEVQ